MKSTSSARRPAYSIPSLCYVDKLCTGHYLQVYTTRMAERLVPTYVYAAFQIASSWLLWRENRHLILHIISITKGNGPQMYLSWIQSITPDTDTTRQQDLNNGKGSRPDLTPAGLAMM